MWHIVVVWFVETENCELCVCVLMWFGLLKLKMCRVLVVREVYLS